MESRNEDLSVPHFSRRGRRLDGIKRSGKLGLCNHNFDAETWLQIMRVLGTSERMSGTPLPALSPTVTGRQTDQINGMESVAYGVQAMGTNDCFDFVHVFVSTFLVRLAPSLGDQQDLLRIGDYWAG